jgi:hypothetical protein
MILGGVKVASSLIGGALGSRASKKAAERAKEIGRLNYQELMRRAEVEQDLGTQEILGLLDSQARQRGTVEGMYSKSGLLLTGTPAAAMQEMEEDMAFNVEQAEESVSERVQRLRFQARMSKLGAEAQVDTYKEQARGDIIGSVFGAVEGGLDMFSAWGGGQNNPPATPQPERFDPTKNYLLTGWQS